MDLTIPIVPTGEQVNLPATELTSIVEPTVEPTVEPKKDGFQEKINELTRKRREAERDAAYWRGQAEARTVPVAPTKVLEPQGGQDLDPNDFDSDADYLKAVATQVKNEIRASVAAERKRNEVVISQTTITKQYQEARAKHTDFDEVALNPSVPITQYMFDAAMGDSLGDVLYHLGKNPTEAVRIASLSPTQQVKEISKIEIKLATPMPPKHTTTPNPPKIVSGGGGSPPAKKEEEMNRTELRAKWERDRLAKAGL